MHLIACRSSWQSKALSIGNGHSLAVMAWSDNLFSFGQSVADAVQILSEWAYALWGYAGYNVKPDSLEVTRSSTRRFPESSFEFGRRFWKLKDHFCLSWIFHQLDW